LPGAGEEGVNTKAFCQFALQTSSSPLLLFQNKFSLLGEKTIHGSRKTVVLVTSFLWSVKGDR